MTFDARERSRSRGEPVNLYFFRYGNTPEAYYAYTDAEHPIITEFDPLIGQVTFEPIPIQRQDIVSSGSMDRTTLEVRTPQDSLMAERFRLHPPSQVLTLKIFQGHVSDGNYLVEWAGRVLGHAREGNEAVYTCEPITTSLKRAGLRRNYQYQCPHVLYSQGPGLCNANREAATIYTTATQIQGALLTVAWPNPAMATKYIGGIAEWTTQDGRTEIRTVIRMADSDTMVLSGIAEGLTPGMVLSLSFGCDHKWNPLDGQGDCGQLHNNVHNYGGQPFIPKNNPIGITNNFY